MQRRYSMIAENSLKDVFLISLINNFSLNILDFNYKKKILKFLRYANLKKIRIFSLFFFSYLVDLLFNAKKGKFEQY